MAQLSTEEKDELYRMRGAGVEWAEVYDRFPEVPQSTLRVTVHRMQKEMGGLSADGPPVPYIEGYRPGEEIDEEEVLAAAVTEWRRTARRMKAKRRQVIEFDYGPICIANLGDQHNGDPGVNYPRMWAEAELVHDTPGMHAALIGDLANNFVIDKLRHARQNHRLAITDEMVLVKHYLSLLEPDLVAAVGGNHDWWSALLTGQDYYGEVITRLAPHLLYDEDQVDATVRVGEASFRVRWRHKWRYNSMLNPTHGIEAAATRGGANFDIGVGGHVHKGGFVRSFKAREERKLACMVGTYKEEDDFATRHGFDRANGVYGVAFVLTERGSWIGFDDLTEAAAYMRAMYPKAEGHPA